MKVISIVGHSGSGKTTLVEKLVRHFSLQGLNIATIKHAHHKVELDTPGKDSHRYKAAGASMSMLLTRDALQLVADATSEREPEQLARRFMSDADLVLAEGFSHAPGVKIEVMRRACGKLPRCTLEDGLIAMVTDMDEIYPELPHFGLEDITGICQFIVERR
ncbi:MAG TPA: molybdopterin-guanine dinucleotide biosynthesis protein B [Gallionella sp.]|jgi:molybdopterin-guanine dinucleotide biosynthesis protein B|nr:MAG: molybdopterin-guanine dinucleotide biosynthesis protein B [Gallionellales bacterium GWA2_54_124]OGT45044.1 MAG: molybdopterin-guanine dinucleotide biosynthesis protein B [Gallionellales bacterium RIFOXYD2_FULL_52_7]HCI52505.1 molybdopterin-guanine dinucleotide biosynthesis protein B [Gallionella sp.]